MTKTESRLSSDATMNVPVTLQGATPELTPGISEPLDHYSFFQALRQTERQHPQQSRIGYARRPADELVRISQPAELTFAPSALTRPVQETRVDKSTGSTVTGQDRHSVSSSAAALPLQIAQRFIGLLGPSGPMPLHFTETVRDRRRHAGDESLQAFLDIFHHRIATLFYRAWSDAQPIVQRDRPDEDNFARFLGSLVGQGSNQLAARSAYSAQDVSVKETKQYHAGHFVGMHRHAEGLAAILTRSLQVPARVQSFALRTLTVSASDRSFISSRRGIRHANRSNCLGRSAQLGNTVRDRSSMIDVRIGPLNYARFQQFLPNGLARQHVANVVHHYVGLAIHARVTIQLQKDEIPSCVLGRSGQLGRTCWMGSGVASQDRSDYCFEISSTPKACVRNESSMSAGAADHEVVQ